MDWARPPSLSEKKKFFVEGFSNVCTFCFWIIETFNVRGQICFHIFKKHCCLLPAYIIPFLSEPPLYCLFVCLFVCLLHEKPFNREAIIKNYEQISYFYDKPLYILRNLSSVFRHNLWDKLKNDKTAQIFTRATTNFNF